MRINLKKWSQPNILALNKDLYRSFIIKYRGCYYANRELLKSYVNNKKLNMNINDFDIKLLIEQSLQTLLYPAT